MKAIRALFALLFLATIAHAGINNPGSGGGGSGPTNNGSEVSLVSLSQGQEYPFLNLLKLSTNWSYGDNTNIPAPDELDINGYPLAGSSGIASHSGDKLIINGPSQAERPGHYVLAWTGGRKLNLSVATQGGGGALSSVSCVGSVTGTTAPSCDGTGCSSFTGSIAGTTLTVTAAPTGSGCSFGVGVPISNASITISTFATPTIITGNSTTNANLCSPNCTGAGGTGTYAINQSQSVGSGTMFIGGRFEVSVTSDNTTTTANWGIILQAVNADSQTSNIAFYHISDEAAWEASATPCGSGKACIVGSLFNTRIKQANFKVLRDLDWQLSNTANCTTWSSRKSIGHITYAGLEYRNAASGTETYSNLSGTTTIQKIGQYVDAGGTGASGGTIAASGTQTATFTGAVNNGAASAGIILTASAVTGTIGLFNTLGGTGVTADTVIIGNSTTNPSYCSPACTGTGGAGTYAVAYVNNTNKAFPRTGTQLVASEAMTATHNDFNITLGTGAQTDKQTVLVLWPATGDATTKIKVNGNTAAPVLAGNSETLANGFGADNPSKALFSVMVYDAVLGGWINQGGFVNSDIMNSGGYNRGINCGAPADVFIEINAELGTTPYHVTPFLALDPTTDWVTQYATYVKTNYASAKPIFEITNEPWNGATNICYYLSTKSSVYIGEDAAWTSGFFCGASGQMYGEVGKMISTAGQDLNSVLGAGSYELLAPVQTGFASGFGSVAAELLQTNGYINQTVAPTQSGYAKTAAYKLATRVSVNDYWNVGYAGGNGSSAIQGIEVGIAYCYFSYSISAPCQGLYASQTAAMNTYMNSSNTAGLASFNIYDLINTYIVGIWEGYGQTCSLGPSARPAGCTINVTTPLMFYEGGYSPSKQGSDVVQTVTAATDASSAVLTVASNGCVQGQSINLSSLSGGTWSTAAGNYTVQSATTNTCTINLNSTGLGTLSSANLAYTGSTNYVNYLRTSSYLSPLLATFTTTLYNELIASGGVNPSQYQMASNSNFVGNPWYLWSFDIFGYYALGQCSSCTISSTTLTLGGTITGVFGTGQQLLGGGITANTVLGACTPIGGNVCGSTSGDTFALSQSSNVSSGEQMTGNVIPATVGSTTTSPVTAWKAICTWNGNGAAC